MGSKYNSSENIPGTEICKRKNPLTTSCICVSLNSGSIWQCFVHFTTWFKKGENVDYCQTKSLIKLTPATEQDVATSLWQGNKISVKELHPICSGVYN